MTEIRPSESAGIETKRTTMWSCIIQKLNNVSIYYRNKSIFSSVDYNYVYFTSVFSMSDLHL